jgi:serine/threonine protein kinase
MGRPDEEFLASFIPPVGWLVGWSVGWLILHSTRIFVFDLSCVFCGLFHFRLMPRTQVYQDIAEHVATMPAATGFSLMDNILLQECGYEAADLLGRLFDLNPRHRLTAAEAVAHHYFDDVREPTHHSEDLFVGSLRPVFPAMAPPASRLARSDRDCFARWCFLLWFLTRGSASAHCL